EQAGARRPPPLPRTLPRADRGGPGGRRFLPRHTGRPRGRLPLRLRAPPVDLVPARRPAQPAGGRRPPRGPAPARPAPLRARRPAPTRQRLVRRPAARRRGSWRVPPGLSLAGLVVGRGVCPVAAVVGRALPHGACRVPPGPRPPGRPFVVGRGICPVARRRRPGAVARCLSCSA